MEIWNEFIIRLFFYDSLHKMLAHLLAVFEKKIPDIVCVNCFYPIRKVAEICFCFLFAENLKIRCNQKQHRTCKYEEVEYAMHVSFVHAEYRRSQQTGHKPCKEHEASGCGYADRREVRCEESRKHKRADDERRGDGHVAEDVEFPKAERKDGDCDGD